MSTVSIARATDDLEAAFCRAMDLAGLGDIVPAGGTVLLKPNQHGGQGFTSPDVLRAGARWALSRGAGEVWIGDGPVWSLLGDKVQEYFRMTGLLQACEDTGATPLDFHAGQFRIFEPESDDLPQTIGLSEYMYEADVVINLPVMKTHFNTLVTLGIKNVKGCIRPIDKKTLHEMELNRGIAHINAMIAPQISATVLDATVAYEGMGPGLATPVDMGLLLASEDVVAIDAVACELMGIEPSQCRLIRFCVERGVGEADLGRIEVVGERVADHRRRFKLPYEAIQEAFPDLTVCSEGACSGCGLNLFRAMEIADSLGQQIKCRTVVIGPDVSTEEQTLLVGQCTKAGWGQAPHVPGCPPTVDAIREAMTGIPAGEGTPRT